MARYSAEAKEAAARLRAMLGEPPKAGGDEELDNPPLGEEGFEVYGVIKTSYRGEPAYLVEHSKGINHVTLGDSLPGVRDISEAYVKAYSALAGRDAILMGMSRLLPWPLWESSKEYKCANRRGKRQKMAVQFIGLDPQGNACFICRAKSRRYEWGFSSLDLRMLENGQLSAMGLHFITGWPKLKATLAVLPTPEEFARENEKNPWPRNAYPEDPVAMYAYLYGRVKALEPR